METLKATQSLIDSVWTLEYNLLPNGKLEVIKYSREDAEGYEKEKTLPRLSNVEDKDRILTGVYLEAYEPFKYWAEPTTATFYEVENPKHIFSYND